MPHRRLSALLFSASALVSLGCGGNVVVDKEALGSGGGSTTTSSTTTVTTEPDLCTALLSDFGSKFEAAIACNPLINIIQCDGSAAVLDSCGCPVLANELNQAQVKDAISAQELAENEGCLPPCGVPCGPFGPGYCQSNAGGTMGVCHFDIPD